MASIDIGSIPFPSPTNGAGLLVTSWALAVTWGLVVMQMCSYMPNRKRDNIILQSLVVFLFVCETASTAIACVSVHYQLLVLEPGSFEALFQLPQGFLIMNFFNHMTLCCVNLFLIWRYQRFAKTWWLATPLIFVTLTTLGLHWYTDTIGLRSTSVASGRIDIPGALAYIDKAMKLAKASASLEFTVVSATYILLLTELSSYLRQNLLSGRVILKRIIFMTLESGTVTVALAAGYVAISFKKADPAGLTSIAACAARAYYMTMLFNLNWRNDGGMVMQEPSFSHITSQLRTRPSVQLKQSGSSATDPKQTVIHISQDKAIEDYEQYRHDKEPYASIDRKQEAAV